jgi:hypothetical protein
MNMAFMTFHSVGNVIIPTDEVHHFSEGWRKTTNHKLWRFKQHKWGSNGDEVLVEDSGIGGTWSL